MTTKENKKVQVAFYGGSFDPIHYGHVFTVCYLATLGNFDNVLVAPVCAHAHSKSLTDYNKRYEMCRIALNWIPKTHVTDIEKQVLDLPSYPDVNYTYHTIKRLKELHPDWNIQFVIGADVASQIPTWDHGQDLLSIAQPFVLGRHGYEYQEHAVLPNISSTEIRNSFKYDSKHSVAKMFIPKPVYEFILDNNLYESLELKPGL